MKSSFGQRTLIISTTALAAFMMLACSTTPTPETRAPAATATTATVELTETPVATEAAVEEAAPPAAAEGTAAVTNTKINLNDTSGDELLNTIPDFNQRWVREFLEYRPYISIQQFRREMSKYTNDSQISTWEEYVYVPVNVDESDAATLMQIPGVDESTANQLIDARPYGANEAFLQKLAEISGVDTATASGYLAQ